MAPKKPALTAKALQALLSRIGSATSGTKSALLERFQRNLPRVYSPARPAENAPRKIRVVSIDMGIKNLAFCDAEVQLPRQGSGARDACAATMHVLRWKKLDLAAPANTTEDEDTDAGAGTEEDDGPFSPARLSKTAYALITEHVLSAAPDVVLIEKQRWRSGGGSAVQQWTLRVNTLEAMLWAVLETLKRNRSGAAAGGVAVRAVDPKRVGAYWLGLHARAAAAAGAGAADGADAVGAAESSKTLSRSRADKSAKIAVLRGWLADGIMSSLPSTPARTPHMTFTVAASADATRQSVLRRGPAPRTKKARALEAGGELSAVEMKKLDDVADCFLQAAAWVAWEANRGQLLAVCGSGAGVVDEARIMAMVGEIGGV